jgi:hypothetical protein
MRLWQVADGCSRLRSGQLLALSGHYKRTRRCPHFDRLRLAIWQLRAQGEPSPAEDGYRPRWLREQTTALPPATERRGAMPGNPHECRLNAKRFLRLARRASGPEARQNLTDLAEILTKLAAEIESDNGLLRTFSELEFSEPCDALPRALKFCA